MDCMDLYRRGCHHIVLEDPHNDSNRSHPLVSRLRLDKSIGDGEDCGLWYLDSHAHMGECQFFCGAQYLGKCSHILVRMREVFRHELLVVVLVATALFPERGSFRVQTS